MNSINLNQSPDNYQTLKPFIPDSYSFIVWLTHDVDRVSKTFFHTLFYSFKERRFIYHLNSLFSRENSYWNFNRFMELETRYGAKSTSFFLNETMKPNAFEFKSQIICRGRYSLEEPQIQKIIMDMDKAGWEIGLHGSFLSYNNRLLLKSEKKDLEDILGHKIYSSRQHYWNREGSLTWQIQEEIGLKIDATFIKRHSIGFQTGFIFPFQPNTSRLIVFPTSIMEAYLHEIAPDIKDAKKHIDDLISQCIHKRTVLTSLWHNRLINPHEFPYYYDTYEYFLKACKERGACFMLAKDIQFHEP